MANPVMNIPGLGGFLGMQDIQQQNDAQQVRQMIGLASLVNQQRELALKQQTAPLQLERLKLEVAESRRKADQAKLLDDAISKLDPADQPLARLAPQQYVANRNKAAGLTGAPEIIKLQTYERTLREAGRTTEADQVAAVIQNKEMGGTSQHERAFKTLQTLQQLVAGGQRLTPEQEIQAQSARAILGRQEMRIDPITKEPYFAQPITIPGSLTVGGSVGGGSAPGGAPVNAVPPLTSGRAPLDPGSEKEIQGMADARALALDLKNAFKPEFGGYKLDVVGDVVTEYGRRFGEKGGETQRLAQFWESYEQWITDMRKDKYGATLTGNEKAQFERLRAKPSQTPSQIQNNLQRQYDLVNRALGRRMTGLARQGVSQEAIEGAVGWGAPRSSNLVNPTAERKVRRTGTLPNGQKVVEYEDGSVEAQ